MNEPFASRGHAYSGRENGLMIIAPASSLRFVATQLSANLAGSEDIESRDWPREVARVELGTPVDFYVVSFHVETQRRYPASNVPRGSRTFWLLVWMLPFAIIGMVVAASWLMQHAF